MSNSSQQFVDIEDIHDDVVVCKDGSIAMVLQTSAVNFDLLSQNEQMAIIGSFAGLLNSLSFSIQILIRSKRLDISKYLETLRVAEAKQTNPLLQVMMQHYRNFVATIIRENEVLDKQFYVIVSASPIELGILKGGKDFQKALTVLTPRRDHLLRQLGRIGLKTSQLNTERLIRLFYDLYNEPLKPTFSGLDDVPHQNQPVAQTQTSAVSPPSQPVSQPIPNIPQTQPVTTAVPQSSQTQPLAKPQQPQPVTYQQPGINRSAPFVVEELHDEYTNGTAA